MQFISPPHWRLLVYLIHCSKRMGILSLYQSHATQTLDSCISVTIKASSSLTPLAAYKFYLTTNT